MHPLQNGPVVLLLHQLAGDDVFWHASCFEFQRKLLLAREVLMSEKAKAGATKLKNLTRLQRSLIHDRVAAAVSKDSTVQVSKFLFALLEGIQRFVSEAQGVPGVWRVSTHL